jgi:CheY-like chemotaxis protein
VEALQLESPCVLIVDDDDDMLETLASSLGKKLEVTVAKDGKAALREIDAHHFDAVVLDLNMPEMGGEAVLAQLSQRREAPPVILASGLPLLPRIAASWGVREWIRKPYRVEYLLHKIYEVVHH